jgi:methionyl-tRNA synthetase
MPGKASKLLDMMGVEKTRRSFKDAQLGADEAYGAANAPVGDRVWDALFPPLPVEN